MTVLHCDLETYSDLDIRDVGAYRYAESDAFEILIIAYSVDAGPVKAIDVVNAEPQDLEEFTALLFDPAVEKRAFNANFERVCLAKWFDRPMPPEEWVCDMVEAARLGLPLSLEKCAEALELDVQKDTKGKALIRYFSQPCKPTKVNGGRTRNLPEHAPDKWQQFIDYCIKDVKVEQAIHAHTAQYKTTETEQDLWTLDQHINDRGIHVDRALMLGAYELDKLSKHELMDEAKALTGLSNPNSTPQLLEWFKAQGVELPNLQKKTVQEALKTVTGAPKQMLELRQQMSKTSVKKYNKMYAMACNDDRIRGAFQFYGAGTGRWAGRGVQLQNLTKHSVDDLTLDGVREAIKAQNFDAINLFSDLPHQDLLSQLIRTTFTAPEGKMFAVSDFSAIEARVIAWFAKESWRLEVFATHAKIYEASASQMFGVPIEEITKGSPLRQKGKVSELALGYQGGTGALKSMGALDMGLKEAELQPLVNSWRKANPNIVEFWKGVQDAAIKAVKTGKAETHGMLFKLYKGYLFIKLPSGRLLAYKDPKLGTNSFGATVVEFKGLDITRKWTTVKTYGGKLVENIVQATARDLLGVSMLRLQKAGFKIVAHVHDEIIVEVDHKNDLKEVERIMSLPVEWAEGLQLDSDGFTSEFYMKD
ncbi:DNA polymerase [Staphylococcus chromogenes]|uniref:DNA polymerase n=1 Tax=Staphylococcus chromogenes TaxID=46126 RepID=UPI0018900165|nr:DNA polymerase [Staphylococcus chromogenes]